LVGDAITVAGVALVNARRRALPVAASKVATDVELCEQT
jgi:hypothetical protein